jgi:hypothetical protein
MGCEACPCEGGGPAIQVFLVAVSQGVDGAPSHTMTIGGAAPWAGPTSTARQFTSPAGIRNATASKREIPCHND